MSGPLLRPAMIPVVVALFSVTLFLSAALLFLVQPMFARFALPLFGSTPAVWTTSLLFFQTVLLAGYAYAHTSIERLGPRRAAALHLGLVALGALALPVAVPEGFAAPPEGSPALALLGALVIGVGLPFFVVSATGPLVQRWLAATDRPAAADPYFLYRASNLGSVAGLLGYPLLLEPGLRLAVQGTAWAIGYGALAVLLILCALVLWRSRAPTSGAQSATEEALPEEELTSARRARWVGLAFVPSTFLLGVSAFLSVDVAPVPLLWVVPLSLYLLSFVAVFSRGRGPARLQRLAVPLLAPAMIGLAVLLLADIRGPLSFVVGAHLAGFFAAALVCHGELARDRPSSRHLTGFYLWVAVGGALGGVFNALLAPLLFDSLAEYALAIVFACLARPRGEGTPSTELSRALDLALPALLAVAVGALLLGVRSGGPAAEVLGTSLVYGFAVGLLLNFARRPARLGLGVAALLIAGGLASSAGERILFRERDFFGIHTVRRVGADQNRLVHGSTLHGAQFVGRPGAPEPLTYYHRTGPIGWALEGLGPDAVRSRAAVIGLGTGSMACYAEDGERWTFYEIDPTVERIARDPGLFTFMRDCPGTRRVVLGDARLSLARAREERYELIVADAFSSDAIPVHLLTREALGTYLSRLEADGVLAFHVSNRYLELRPVLGALARDRGLVCLAAEEPDAIASRVPGKTESKWVVMARRRSDLRGIVRDRRFRTCSVGTGAVWSDDYSNVISLLRWL